MPSRLSAFVVPSERFTLRFDRAVSSVPPDDDRVRGAGRRAVVGAIVSVAVVALAALATTAQATTRAATAVAPHVAPPAAAMADVPSAATPADPDPLPALYASAASTCAGLRPSVLAAIHRVETHSSETGEVSSAGARGPMQFLPGTWAAYGFDADGDGHADVDDLIDAVYSAARYLCANGGGDPSRLRDALWNYNHSWAYVDEVVAAAAT